VWNIAGRRPESPPVKLVDQSHTHLPGTEPCPALYIIVYVLHGLSDSGFGGLEVACWRLVPMFAGSHPAETVGYRAKKSSARLPLEGK